jgi:uncharacterized protein (DUF924 family)
MPFADRPLLSEEDSRRILGFWFGTWPGSRWPEPDVAKRWFQGGPELDQIIGDLFGELVNAALFETGPRTEGAEQGLALVLLLDQFTRNVFRGTARAFAGDARALAAASGIIDSGEDVALPPWGRVFLALPMVHAESMVWQDRAVSYLQQLMGSADDACRAKVRSFLESAEEHRAIVRRFGRFPHRNQLLGRVSTKEEMVYLQTGKHFGQQS